MHLSVSCQRSHQLVQVAFISYQTMRSYQIKPTPSKKGEAKQIPDCPSDRGAPQKIPDLPCPVGIDLHPDIFDAVILTQGKRAADATVQRRFREHPTETIVTWAKENLDSSQHLLIIEATSNSFDIVERLDKEGFSCIVVESKQVSKIADAFIDDDQIAAERIARCYLTGMASVVWCPDPKTRERRELLHAYNGAVTDHVRANNELKSFLTCRNIRPGARNLHLQKNREWVETKLELSELGPIQKAIFESLYDRLHGSKAVRDQFYRMICTEVLQHKQMLDALRVVGIGVINAFAIVAIVGDVKRFANAKKLVSYLGLNPGRKKSGNGKDRKIGAGNRGRSDMRTLLIQAAQAVLMKTRKNPNKLSKWGFALFARSGKRNIAVVAIARKLTHALYHLLSGRAINLLEQREPIRLKFYKLSGTLGKEGREVIGLPQKRADLTKVLFEKIGWPEHEEPANCKS